MQEAGGIPSEQMFNGVAGGTGTMLSTHRSTMANE